MFREIRVKNFKCFDDFILPIKPVNILTGLNGMGKSTIIQSLLLMRQSVKKNGGMKGLHLNEEYISLGNAQDILFEKASEEKIGLGFTDGTGEYFWEYQYAPESDYLPVIAKEKFNSDAELFGHHFSYLSAYRIQPQNLYGIRNEEDINHREFGNNGEFALQYLGLHGDDEVENNAVIIDSKLGNSLRNQTQLWLSRISPGVSPKVTVDMQLRNAEVRYEFIEGREKTQSYKSMNVGFGITYVLPLIVAILSAKAGDIVVMENPEAHIHPAGQRMLGELIARAGAGGVQIIAETHSDHILNGVRLSVKDNVVSADDVEIAYFYKDEKDGYRHKCAQPRILPDGRLDIWPEGFFDEWDKALYELI